MKKHLRIIILWISLFFIFGCAKPLTHILYPINNQFNETDKKVPFYYEGLYENKNMHQLRISRTYEFLPVENTGISKKNNSNNQITTSDYPYKRFKQALIPQDLTNNFTPSTVEETYIYLDKFNSERDNNVRLNRTFGYAYYFITYPTIDYRPFEGDARTLKYFNNPSLLYSNIIKSIQVGYWIKSPRGELLLIYRSSNKKIVVYSGDILENKGISISKVSHPDRVNNSILKIPKFIEYENSLNNYSDELIEDIEPDEIRELTSKIKSKVVFIDLKNVFDLNEKNALMFYNIPYNKKFVIEIEKDDNTELYNIDRFMLGKDLNNNNRFYIKSNSPDSSKYLIFKKKEVIFLRED